MIDILSKHLKISDEEKEKLKEIYKLSIADRAVFFELYCFVQSSKSTGKVDKRDWMRLSQYYTKALLNLESSKNDRAKEILLRFMDKGSDEVDKAPWNENSKERETS